MGVRWHRIDVGSVVGLPYYIILCSFHTLTAPCSVLHFILFVYACQYCHIRRKSRATVDKVEPENVAQIDVKPKLESPSPVIIACVHCQSDFSSRGHEDYELVAGAPDRPTTSLFECRPGAAAG